VTLVLQGLEDLRFERNYKKGERVSLTVIYLSLCVLVPKRSLALRLLALWPLAMGPLV
jgi:hypothetical protein